VNESMQQAGFVIYVCVLPLSVACLPLRQIPCTKVCKWVLVWTVDKPCAQNADPVEMQDLILVVLLIFLFW